MIEISTVRVPDFSLGCLCSQGFTALETSDLPEGGLLDPPWQQGAAIALLTWGFSFKTLQEASLEFK